jgi:50S ribosomal subunit-associated GTPase HflX
MDPRSQKAGGMLDSYLHDTNAITERLVRGDKGRDLRSSSTRTQGPVTAGKAPDKTQEKKIAASVRKLEKEMDKKTDPALLDRARRDQQGTSTLQTLGYYSPADISCGAR